MLARILALGLVLALTAATQAQRNKIGVGDPAPGLDIETWVDSEGIAMDAEGVYVVMFWKSLDRGGENETARLDELYERYSHRGLEIIVVSPDDKDRLIDFARQQGSRVPYHLGADRRAATSRAWIRASGAKELPVAFIVGKGKIMHIGRPSEADFAEVVEKVLAGRYDPQLTSEAAPKLKTARRARATKNWRLAFNYYDEVIAMDPRVFADVAIERCVMMIADMEDPESGYRYAEDELIRGVFTNDAPALRMLVDRIMSEPDIRLSDRNLDVALEAAKRSLEIEGQRHPEALATLAMVRFHRGEINEAIRLQTQAYFAARPERKAAYKRVLSGYRKAANRAARE